MPALISYIRFSIGTRNDESKDIFPFLLLFYYYSIQKEYALFVKGNEIERLGSLRLQLYDDYYMRKA